MFHINPHILSMSILITAFCLLVFKTTSNNRFYSRIFFFFFFATPWRYVALGLSQLCVQTSTHMIQLTQPGTVLEFKLPSKYYLHTEKKSP